MKDPRNDSPGYFIWGPNDEKICKRLDGNNDNPLLVMPNGAIPLNSLIEQAYNPKAAIRKQSNRGRRH